MVTEALTAPLGPGKPTLNPMMTVPSIQDDENPDLDAIEHVEMVAHDPRTGREEHNDGLHLVTTHFLLSSKTASRHKYAWFAGSCLLLFVQMLSAISVMLGSFVPNCTANHQCFDGQYCCPR
jgi:hypothetical protein